MKLIKLIMVGIVTLTMVIAQDQQGQSPMDHLDKTIQDGMDAGVLDDNDAAHIRGAVGQLREAVNNEHGEEGCDNCAGDVMESVDEWAQGLRDEGNHNWADRIMTDLCHLEFAMHKRLDQNFGGNEGPDCEHEGDEDGDGDHDGPPPFEDVDTNGDGSIDREEARAMFGHDDEGNPDPEFDAEYDRIAGEDGVVDHAEYDQSVQEEMEDQGPGTCDVCGYEYGGPDDHHGHCRACGAEMNSDDDWRAHCDENWEHCKPQAGDTCGYVGPSGDKCGYVHTGDPDEDHHHCDTCGMPVNSGAEMEAHCNENPEHCHGDDGPPPFEEVDANGDGSIDREEARDFFGDEPNFDEEYDKIDTNGDGEVDHAEYMASDGGDGSPPNNHWDGNCAALCGGHGEYWLDSDGDGQPEDGPYATWDHDADGNPVDCGCGGGDGDHEGGGYDNLGGDTSWADAAYQIDGNQEHYDIVMSVPEADREKVYEDIKRDVEEHRGDHEGDEGGPMAGDTCQFMDADGVQCSYVYTGTEADQDHHHN